jgi:hypothetical protein
MLVRLKPGGALSLGGLGLTIKPGQVHDLPRSVVERHAGRFEVVTPDPASQPVVVTDVSSLHVGGGWYEIPGHVHRVRKEEAELLLADYEATGSWPEATVLEEPQVLRKRRRQRAAGVTG